MMSIKHLLYLFVLSLFASCIFFDQLIPNGYIDKWTGIYEGELITYNGAGSGTGYVGGYDTFFVAIMVSKNDNDTSINLIDTLGNRINWKDLPISKKGKCKNPFNDGFLEISFENNFLSIIYDASTKNTQDRKSAKLIKR